VRQERARQSGRYRENERPGIGGKTKKDRRRDSARAAGRGKQWRREMERWCEQRRKGNIVDEHEKKHHHTRVESVVYFSS